jgi:hypothetical protein
MVPLRTESPNLRIHSTPGQRIPEAQWAGWKLLLLLQRVKAKINSFNCSASGYASLNSPLKPGFHALPLILCVLGFLFCIFIMHGDFDCDFVHALYFEVLFFVLLRMNDSCYPTQTFLGFSFTACHTS